MKIRKISALRMNKGVFGGGNTRKEGFRGILRVRMEVIGRDWGSPQ